MKMLNGKILVTGGAGFIGSHVCQRLIGEGFSVVCLDNFNNFYDPKHKEENLKDIADNKNFTLIKGDILDKNLLEKIFTENKIEKIIHLAAMPGVRYSIENPLESIDVDVKGTVNLLDFAKNYKVSQFVFASSSSVYGKQSALPFSESEKNLVPISVYAASKLSAEILCRTYNELYALPVAVLRFFNVYGIRQRPDLALPKFAGLLQQGKEIQQYGDGQSSRDYTYIDDIVEGIMKVLDREFNFEIFNLGNSSPVKLKDFIDLVGKKMGATLNIKKLPMQPGDPDITYADNKKAKELLDWSPKISLEEGIDAFLTWYKKQ